MGFHSPKPKHKPPTIADPPPHPYPPVLHLILQRSAEWTSPNKMCQIQAVSFLSGNRLPNVLLTYFIKRLMAKKRQKEMSDLTRVHAAEKLLAGSQALG